MGLNPADGEDVVSAVRRMYAQAETDTIRILADELGKGTYRENWAQIKLRKLGAVNGKITREVIDKLDVENEVWKAVEKSYRDGSDAIVADFRSAGIKDVNAGFGSINEQAVKAAARETVGKLQGTHTQILRKADDVFRHAVEEAQYSTLTGTATRRQASQKVLNKFANQGITGFRDSTGRMWSLSSYSEMAMRTSTGQAMLQGQFDRIQQNNRDLVIVSGHADCCPLCAPWQGAILSISGNSSRYSSVDEARASGLWHPNCRHSVSAYIEGLTKKPDYERDAGAYKTRMIQRKNERQIRKWKRRKAAAMTDKAEVKAKSKIQQWQATQRELVEQNDLKRLYYREQIEQAH